MPAAVIRSVVLCASTICGAALTLDAAAPLDTEWQAKQRLRLTIATVNLADMAEVPAQTPAATAPAPEPSTRPVWRHTFGAERKTPPTPQPVRPKSGIPADVILLQGVTGMTQVRQLFPAQDYHLIMSRQLSQHRAPLPDASTLAAPLASGTTAVVLSRQAALRVVGQEHLLLGQTVPETARPLAAATAVRIVAGGHALWAVAVDLASDCGEDGTPTAACQAWQAQITELNAWIEARRSASETVVVAGSFHRPLERRKLPGELGRLHRFPNDPIKGNCQVEGHQQHVFVETSDTAPALREGSRVVPEPAGGAAACALLVDLDW